MKIDNNIKGLREFFEADLAKFLHQMHDDTRLWQACDYCLTAPGKRIRPVLTLMVGQMIGVPLEKLINYSAAIEFLHNSSLVHDDLPGIDNDDYRRGRLTCHKQYDEGTAILAGDALIVLAYQLICYDSHISNDQKQILVNILSDAFYKLCIGQVLDLANMGHQRSDNQNVEELFLELKRRHLHKTGALMSCCFSGPAAIAGENDNKFEFLTNIGEHLGLLFQMTDDILDAQESGNTQAQDERLGLITYVSLFGIDEARRYAKHSADEIIEKLSSFGGKAEDLKEFVRYIESRTV
ncbi:MAG: polyprenyl synthetase family protein [Deltaproteobacteria bacterium]|nr:polyprenyl synthetase family protein [Deltaproteobacteria bacterium]